MLSKIVFLGLTALVMVLYIAALVRLCAALSAPLASSGESQPGTRGEEGGCVSTLYIFSRVKRGLGGDDIAVHFLTHDTRCLLSAMFSRSLFAPPTRLGFCAFFCPLAIVAERRDTECWVCRCTRWGKAAENE